MKYLSLYLHLILPIVGPNSILIKILKFLKNDISCQLTDIFNMLFTSGVFPYIQNYIYKNIFTKIFTILCSFLKFSKLFFQNIKLVTHFHW